MRVTSALEPCPLLLGAYLPEANLPAVEVEVVAGKAPALKQTQSGWRFTHVESVFPQDGYHLLGGLMRAHGLAHGLYSTHSACIDGHLLVGHSGAGKTSVLLELLALGLGNIMATNKTMLDTALVAHGGTKAITFEAADAPQGMNAKQYGSRMALLPEAHQLAKAPQPVRAIWFVKLTDGKTHAQPLSPLSALHRLYPFMMDKVNADVLLAEGAVVFTADDAAAAKQLAAQLPKALAHIPAYQISGSRKAVAQHIQNYSKEQ